MALLSLLSARCLGTPPLSGSSLPAILLTTQLQRADTDDLSSFLALKTHLHLLRAKLAELPGQPLLVRTCCGQGYALYRAAG